MQVKELAIGRRDLPCIHVTSILPDPNNIREDLGDIEGLAKDISENGLLQPLKIRNSVEKNKVILIDGHRRLAAIQYAIKNLKAPIESVYCIPENKGGNEETRLIEMLSTGTTGKPLTCIEQAKAIKRLVDFNWPVAQIATKLAKSENQIRQLLDLNSAAPELRDAVSKNTISVTAACDLAKASPDVQKQVIEKAKIDKKKLKVSDIQKAVKGKTYMISTKKLTSYLEEAKTVSKNDDFWKGAVYGLQVSLGMKEFKIK